MADLAVVGHGTVVAHLAAAMEEDRLTHALLLAGPPSVGKTTVARWLAGRLLDGEAWATPVEAHPDLWLEDGPLEHIGIGRMRAGGARDAAEPSLQDFLALRSYAGGSKVAIIARADRLTLEAANSILRTVEEPPAGTHLLLAAAHPERLPPTLLSRLQTVTLAPVPAAEISPWLETQGAARELARTAAALSGGRPGRALQLSADPDLLAREREALDRFVRAAGAGVREAVRAADSLAPPADGAGRERSVIQLSVWAEVVRDALCHAVGQPGLVRGIAPEESLAGWSELPPWRLIGMLQSLVDAADQLERNANPKLCYEVLFLDLFTRQPAPSPPGARVSGAGRPG